jgi:hypothetical protein
MKEDKTTIKVTVRDGVGRKVPIKRVKRGSKQEHEALFDTTGLKGPVTLTVTIIQEG